MELEVISKILTNSLLLYTEGLKKVEETRFTIAKKMLNQNLDITLIVEVTGLSKKEIEKVIEKVK